MCGRRVLYHLWTEVGTSRTDAAVVLTFEERGVLLCHVHQAAFLAQWFGAGTAASGRVAGAMAGHLFHCNPDHNYRARAGRAKVSVSAGGLVLVLGDVSSDDRHL